VTLPYVGTMSINYNGPRQLEAAAEAAPAQAEAVKDGKQSLGPGWIAGGRRHMRVLFNVCVFYLTHTHFVLLACTATQARPRRSPRRLPRTVSDWKAYARGPTHHDGSCIDVDSPGSLTLATYTTHSRILRHPPLRRDHLGELVWGPQVSSGSRLALGRFQS
jgi:hypothetical protein